MYECIKKVLTKIKEWIMANYATLKAAIAEAVKTNGNEEITGQLMQNALIAIIDALGAGTQFKGIATPETEPGTPDYNVSYLGGAGTYSNFGDTVTVSIGKVVIFSYNGEWTQQIVDVASWAQASNNLYFNSQLPDVAAKTITAPDFKLLPGGCIKIHFNAANTAANPTLNVNGTGAKNMRYKGLPVSATNSWKADETVMAYYNNYMQGTWELVSLNYDSPAFLNVNDVNEETGAYSASEARAAVPVADRKPGLNITYLLSTGQDTSEWVIEQFIGVDIDDWAVADNWKTIGPVSVSQNTQTGHTEINIGGGTTTPVASIRDINTLWQFYKEIEWNKKFNSSFTELIDDADYYVTPYLPFGGGELYVVAGLVDSNIKVVAYNSGYIKINQWNAGSADYIYLPNLDSSYAYIRCTFKYNSGGYAAFNKVREWDNVDNFKSLFPARRTQTLTSLETLTALITDLRTKGYIFGGIVAESDSPVEASPKYKVFYIAGDNGTYTNFGNLELQRGAIIINVVSEGQFTQWSSPFSRRIALDTDITELNTTITAILQVYTCLLNNTRHSTMPILEEDRSIAYGYRVKSNGSIENPAAAADWYATPYIPVSYGNMVWTVSEVNNNFFLAYYDENKVKQNSWSANAATRSFDITTRGYIRASFKKNGGGNVTLRGIKIWDNINNIENYTLVKQSDISLFITQAQAEAIAEAAVAQLDVTQAVNDWLDAHPEATTTVEDGSISIAKLDSTLAQKANSVLTNGNVANRAFLTIIGYGNYNNNATGSRNTIVGVENLTYLTTGEKNIAIGYHSMYRETTGQQSTCVGNEAGDNISTGGYNVAIGANALRCQSTEDVGEPRAAASNVCIGYNTMYRSYGNNNLAIGTHALEGGSYDAYINNCIAIGYYAGNHHPTGVNNRFYLDNLYRDGSYVNEQIKGMMYGEFNASPESQMLRINCGIFKLPYLPTSNPNVAGVLWNDSGTVKISAGV